ncbi:c-type cytochrome [Sorangium sp. So ce315]|uniref:c-type cytochrome n=1 Tax=Sorangium sp. So ce315 TaxID=3133299 RepID=UPI003F638A1C
MRARGVPAAALACAALACGAGGCGGDPETKIVEATAVEHGAALFRDPSVAETSFNRYSCATCHEAIPGEAGDAILPGAPLAGAVDRPHYWGGQEVDLLSAINHCLYYFMTKDVPWTAEDEAARAMFAYLESLPADGDAAEAVPFTPVYILSRPPAGDPERGALLHERACASCHGRARSGEGRLVERAPVLPDQTLDEHPRDRYTAVERLLIFVEKVRHGGFVGYGGQMPPFSLEVLSEEEFGDLLSFYELYELR